VLQGITPSDMVITTGAYAMDDGTQVKIGAPPVSADDDKADGKRDKSDSEAKEKDEK
jgi:HlyD family secretion protein